MSPLYNHMLFATDLGPQSLLIGQHAVNFSQLCKAKLTMLHIIEPAMSYSSQFSQHEMQLKQAQEHAQLSLISLGDHLNIPKANQRLVVGTPQDEILATSRKLQCDLIIVGSHGVGGYTHLLGSTAHYLLENSKCNVLIVQVSQLATVIQTTLPAGSFLWQQPSLLSTLNPSQKPQYGSEHGFGENVQRGPRLTKRPKNSPYRGGTRSRTSEEDENE